MWQKMLASVAIGMLLASQATPVSAQQRDASAPSHPYPDQTPVASTTLPSGTPAGTVASGNDGELHPERRRGTTFTYEYVPPRNPELKDAYDFARDIDLFGHLFEVQGLDGMLDLPRPIKFVTAECRQVNAFYSPERSEVVLCYEMIALVVGTAGQYQKAAHLDGDFLARFVLANMRFIALHETAHALIDILDLPSTGREEDAADQLAGTLMLLDKSRSESATDVADNLKMAAVFFKSLDDGNADANAYADTHSLGQQRFYNLMCMVYGSNPAKFLRIVTGGALPVERAEDCPEESHKITTAWARLLVPHFAPRYQYTDEEAQQVDERATREQGRNLDRMPYVR